MEIFRNTEYCLWKKIPGSAFTAIYASLFLSIMLL